MPSVNWDSWRSRESEVSLLLVGDTNVQNRSDPAEPFEPALPALETGDVLFGNMEMPLRTPSSDPAAPDIPHKSGWKHSDPKMIDALRAAGFKAVGCANNVTYGRDAVLDTISRLETAGIAFCGIGRNRQEARKPAIVEKRGIRFGFLSYTSVYWPVGHASEENSPGVATMKIHTSYEPGRRALEMPGAPPTVVTTPDGEELAELREDIKNLTSRADIVVVSFHWGISSSFELADYQRTVGHAAIDAGADVVIGHHPHVPQGIEVWKGKPIFYSLGNFVFDWQKMKGRSLEGLLVRIMVRDGKLSKVSFVPTQRNAQNNVEVLDPSGDAGRKTIDKVRALSAEFETDIAVEGHEAVVGLEGK